MKKTTYLNNIGIPIANLKNKKYIVVSRKFDGCSSAAIPLCGQIATNSKLLAYTLYYWLNRFSYKHTYSIAVMLVKQNNKGTYDAIKR